jgi:hypothetical protein
MNNIVFFTRKITRGIIRRLKLDHNRFKKNALKLAEAKSKSEEFVDLMPGINLPMVIQPEMYFARTGYSQYIFEPNSLDFIHDHLKPGNTFLDIGANIGYFSLVCAKIIGTNGRVIAFEPGDFAFNLLAKNKDLNKFDNIDIYQSGFGEKNEILEFNSGSPGMEVYNSLGDIVHTAADPNKFNKTLVQIFQGATWLKNNHIDYIDLMKLDVEGGEYNVLKGMLEIFQEQKIALLLIEIVYETSQAFGYHPRDILSMLKECGYDWFRLRPFGRLEPLLENDIGNPEDGHMFVAVSKKYQNLKHKH